MLALPAPSAERDLANYLALREARFENPHLCYYIAPRPPREPWWTFEIHDAPKKTKLWAVSILWLGRYNPAATRVTLGMVLATSAKAAKKTAKERALAAAPELNNYYLHGCACLNAKA